MRHLIRATVASLAMIASFSVAVSAAGAFGSWTSTELRDTPGAQLQDADFRGRDVAVAWREPGGLWVRTSTDAGDSFAARELVAGSGLEAEADICGDDLFISYREDLAEGHLIAVATRDVGATGFEDLGVQFSRQRVSHPDVACAGERLFVGWLQRVGDRDRIMVKHTYTRGAAFERGGATDLGRASDYGAGPALAGVSDRAYLVSAHHTSGGSAPSIVLHRWSVGSGALAPVSYLGAKRISKAGSRPVIAAAGDTVVVAWQGSNNGVKARVSHDRGATWARSRGVDPVAGGIEDAAFSPRSIAVRGSRIVLAYALEGCSFAPPFECSSREYLATTNDDFVTRKRTKLSNSADDLVVGFVNVCGEPTLGAALDKGSRVRFLRKD